MTNEPTTPKRLWKYRKWNNHARAMIEHGELKFSTFAEINDPFEFRWHHTLPTDDSEIDQLARELLAQQFPFDTVEQRKRRYRSLVSNLKKLAKEHKGKPHPWLEHTKYGIFSAAEHCDDVLMWSHYGNNHCGVAIAVVPELIRSFRFLPIRYTDTVPIIKAWDYLQPSDELLVKMALTKSNTWQYEREWRSASKPGIRRFAGCVQRVVIGAQASDTTRGELRQAALNAPQNVEVHEARLSNTHYALDIIPPISD